jgi:hypothetical protein
VASARARTRTFLLLLALSGAALPGCWYSFRAGRYEAVTTRAEPSCRRVGRAFLIRGLIGWWSIGMDRVACKLRDAGVHVEVFREIQACRVAAMVRRAEEGLPDREPLVIAGHSNGADMANAVCRALDGHVTVDLLATIDPSHPHHTVTPNVRRVHNLYYRGSVHDYLPPYVFVSQGWFEAEDPSRTRVYNGNIRVDRLDLWKPDVDHFQIDDLPAVQDEIVREILRECVPREAWAARRGSATPTPPGR